MSIELPRVFFENAISKFSDATKGYVALEVFHSEFENEFMVKCSLQSKFVSRYKLDVVEFKYGIAMYPVTVCIFDNTIAKEVGVQSYDSIFASQLTCKNKDEFFRLIESLFLSNTFIKTVSDLIKLAQVNSAR
ncbi:hypothetical protein MSG37_10560 [Shewanella sp. 1CM18E]|uniref:hypothetical protein n=1 Tax=Shewanella sp. 1CM18E TaxID=2929169 RepID=UPI0020C12011|nr:hypothetical protein [Shewanella sp. 1CM18E]MCK8045332.1 hypothetical protein [Shewanella sp. 1CM18E]